MLAAALPSAHCPTETCHSPGKLLQALLKSFHFRGHVGNPAYPVGRVATFEDPDFVIRLRALRVPHSAERFVTRNALHAYLCRKHVLRRFPCGLCRRSDQTTTA